jgi:hypothetical protein
MKVNDSTVKLMTINEQIAFIYLRTTMKMSKAITSYPTLE